jgi:hypothetical protein
VLGGEASTAKQALVDAIANDHPLHRAAIAGALLRIDTENEEARRIVTESLPTLLKFLASTRASNPDSERTTRYFLRSGVQKGDDPVDMKLRRKRQLIIAAIGELGASAREAIPVLREEAGLGNWDLGARMQASESLKKIDP